MDHIKTFSIIKNLSKSYPEPVVSKFSHNKDAFKILISTLLSLRTRDETTYKASLRLFALASTPEDMIKLRENEIRNAIYPVGFYKVKSRNILEISKKIISEFPDNMEKLLELPGVGRKTANLVLGLAFNKPSICVDIHVHRISNRIGWIKTKSPEETEYSLMKLFPKEYWIELNEYLVRFGQNICKPVKPKCNQCPVSKYCAYFKK